MAIQYYIAPTRPDQPCFWGNEQQRNEARRFGSGMVMMVEDTSRNRRDYSELSLTPQSGGVTSEGRQKINPVDLGIGLLNFFNHGGSAYYEINHFLQTHTGVIRFTPVDAEQKDKEIYLHAFEDQQNEMIARKVLDFIQSSDPKKIGRRLCSGAFGHVAGLQTPMISGGIITTPHLKRSITPTP